MRCTSAMQQLQSAQNVIWLSCTSCVNSHDTVIWSVKPGTKRNMSIKPALFVKHNRVLLLHAQTQLSVTSAILAEKDSKIYIEEQLIW